MTADTGPGCRAERDFGSCLCFFFISFLSLFLHMRNVSAVVESMLAAISGVMRLSGSIFIS